MSSSETSSPFQGTRFWRILIYTTLIVFACMYLLPLFVMLVTSFKELDEIRQGNMLALPQVWTVEPWVSAWGTACIGLTCEGISGYFTNSIMITVPGVLLSTTLGALNGYVLTKWRFRGHRWVFGLMLFGCFIPFQVVLVPMSQVLGTLGLANTTAGLVLVHAIYGLGFTTLFFRNYYEAFPSELIRAAMIDGAGFFRMFFRILLPSSGPIIVVTIIWQFTNIWNDFLFGASFASGDTAPITVALNNLVNSSTGVKEYNVHMAGAMIAALPTLLVYILAGRYFVRGLMAGSVKG
ncbi:carbohydrate ABC transporter permease [Enterovibrio norvegicus]|uniref:Sugar ABC transporter permease n=1 Tax=Enterovibrio norvegicus TaxID=188144 RepID=A0A2N7LAP1_9GAMM|nr:carbohydrate ABC transporter permease [Enterovibrio norvegicus]PML82303.1 sugar ABC transporter permease [Enterovibrio norvegicus]PMN69328.1 sugar ABC transporter permease [Enterovibrio norvegicus]PMN91867.1 sugar ABC transporter permease [Enterovibrio norvegicus]